jgi:hypothetical protein
MRRRSPASGPDRTQKLVGPFPLGGYRSIIVPRMSEHGVEALLGLAFFGLIILFLWTSL